MIFDKNTDNPDFNTLKKDVVKATEPLVETIVRMKPGKKTKKSNTVLVDNSSLFFKAAADLFEGLADNKTKKHDEDTNPLTILAKKTPDLDKTVKKTKERTSGFMKSALDNVATLGDNLSQAVKDAKPGEKASNLADSVTQAVKDAKPGEKAANFAETLSQVVKDAKPGEKAGNLVDSVTQAVKDAKPGEKAASLADSVSQVVKDAKLDQKLEKLGDNLSHTLKDAKLDKKMATLAETSGVVLSNATDRTAKAWKDAKLDEKFSGAASSMNKTLGEAELPEKLFEAANFLPGVTVKNPKKAAKAFRRNRAKALKKVGQYQYELTQRLPFVEQKKKSFPWLRTGLGTAAGLGAGYAGVAANNSRIWQNIQPLTNKLPGETSQHYSNSGNYMTFYKVAGSDKPGTPVVFVHGIGAGNSSYEWLQNFPALAENYKTYAYDLLGFGNSAKPDVRYTAELYVQQLTDFLEKVVGQPAYIIASSLSASYAIQVAFRHPELVEKLVLVEPTGLNPQADKKKVQILPSFTYGLLRSPVLGKGIYSLVAARSAIRSFLETQLFYDKSLVTEPMVQQYYTSAHQEGAEFAPPSFFTGLLNAEIGKTIAKIQQPILMVFGEKSQITTTDDAKTLKEENPNTRLVIVPNAKMLVQWEKADEFNRLALEFLGEDSSKQSSRRAASSANVSHFTRQATPSTEEAAQPTSEYKGDHDVEEEIKLHREAFIGDEQSGGALIEGHEVSM